MAIPHKFQFPPKSNYQPWSLADWRAGAACVAGHLAAAAGINNPSIPVRQAKEVCYGCPVTGDCLRWALDTDPGPGVFGGCTENERTELADAANQTLQLLGT